MPETEAPGSCTAECVYDAPKHQNRLLQLNAHEEYINIAQRNQETSPFLHLPAELRNRIYEYILGHYLFILRQEKESRFVETLADITLDPENYRKILQLLQVSRQFYLDAVLLPFTLNTFIFLNPMDFEKWFAQKLLPAQRHAITTIRAPFGELYFRPWNRVMMPLDELSGLKRIHLTDLPGYASLWKGMIVEEFRACASNKELIIEFQGGTSRILKARSLIPYSV